MKFKRIEYHITVGRESYRGVPGVLGEATGNDMDNLDGVRACGMGMCMSTIAPNNRSSRRSLLTASVGDNRLNRKKLY